jgi:hypothetical protein
MLVGCVSFDCHPGSPFFSHRRRMLLSRLCLLLPTPLALSPQKATPVPTRTLAFSLSSEGHSLDLCSDVPAGLSRSPLPAARALRIVLNFSPQKAGAAASRPAAHARRRKGQSGRRPRHPPCCCRGRDAASDPPRPRSPCRKFWSRWKLIGPFY